MDMTVQMSLKGIENDFDEIFYSKKQLESTTRALHIELQNALLLCFKMEEVGYHISPVKSELSALKLRFLLHRTGK